MKKILLVISLISVLVLTGCDANHNSEDYEKLTQEISRKEDTIQELERQVKELKETNGKEQENNQYQYTLSARKELQAVGEGYVEVLIDTEGNAYLHISGNYENAAEYEKTSLHKIEEQLETYSPNGYDGYGPEAETELKAYKLNMTGVLTAYKVIMGNGGFRYFVFVKENGTLSYLSYDKLIGDGTIEVKDIDTLQDIVSIVENDYTLTPYAIDINGNEISLYDYLK